MFAYALGFFSSFIIHCLVIPQLSYPLLSRAACCNSNSPATASQPSCHCWVVCKVWRPQFFLSWTLWIQYQCSLISLHYTIKGGRFVNENSNMRTWEFFFSCLGGIDLEMRIGTPDMKHVWHIATLPGVTCDDAWRSLLDPTLECFFDAFCFFKAW